VGTCTMDEDEPRQLGLASRNSSAKRAGWRDSQRCCAALVEDHGTRLCSGYVGLARGKQQCGARVRPNARVFRAPEEQAPNPDLVVSAVPVNGNDRRRRA